ncbi:hypothetical protein [Lacticaseibacillus kribbianus]|uniref:hypothetical protein n=1 Tax=Lacticaseibacillus kribbianus TaxID=2926292 RepID=UPI001CD33762|nr:hypothetical protein [Lacticaseibacillus kribbianus]
MTTLGETIQALKLTALQDQTQFQLVATFAGRVGRTGAYVTQAAKTVRVTTDAFASAREATDQLAALLGTLQEPQLTGPGTVTVRLTLPETLFGRLYSAMTFRKDPGYVAFRNTLYKQWVAELATQGQTLASVLRAPTGVRLGLAQATAEAVTTVTALAVVDLPATADPAGIAPATLDWLNTAVWQAMQAPRGEWLTRLAAPKLTAATALPAAVARATRPLPGLADLGADTQLMMAAAYAAGLHVQVLDRTAELVALRDGARERLVARGRVTQLNSAAAAATGDSKQAQKTLLGAAGIAVPRAALFTTLDAALAAFDAGLSAKSLVVKPNNGHHGAGVTVFMLPPTREAFAAAVTAANAFGPVLVELFVPGNSYRFFVLNGAVLAVLECEPAGVVGDGRRTIEALAAARGLTIDDAARAVLASQGKTPADVPLRGHSVFLRFNSNLSTGGRGVAVTDEIDDGYKQLAIAAAQAVHAPLAGVDIAIPNLYLAPTPDHPDAARVLAVTPAPRLAVHANPEMGAGVDLATPLVAALFDAE